MLNDIVLVRGTQVARRHVGSGEGASAVQAEFVSAHSIDDNKLYDCAARTEVSLIIAVMVISSLPLILGMVVWLPGWLEQCCVAAAHVALF